MDTWQGYLVAMIAMLILLGWLTTCLAEIQLPVHKNFEAHEINDDKMDGSLSITMLKMTMVVMIVKMMLLRMMMMVMVVLMVLMVKIVVMMC